MIGCGRVAAIAHIPALQRLHTARIVAFAEPDAERREAAAARIPKARALQHPRDLLDMAEVAAVVICLPNDLHAEVALAAMERGKHVYLEKPLALTLEDARRVVAAREAAGVVGMMGFNQRFNPLYRALREHVGRQPQGKWHGARTVLAAPETGLPEWKRSRRSGGGALLDQASHHFDLIRFVFDDEIAEVSASLRSQRSEADTAIVNLRLSSGLLLQSFLSIDSIDEDRFEVYGEGVRVSVDRYRSDDVEVFGSGLDSGRKGLSGVVRRLAWRIERRRAPVRDPSFGYALARFVESIRLGTSASPGFEDGYRSLAAVLAAEESARSGCVVQLHSPEGGSRVD